jgi:hypothetical protein
MWDLENIISPFPHNLEFMFLGYFSFVLWAYIKVEVLIDRTCFVLSQYDKKIKEIPVWLEIIRQKCQFKIVGEK